MKLSVLATVVSLTILLTFVSEYCYHKIISANLTRPCIYSFPCDVKRYNPEASEMNFGEDLMAIMRSNKPIVATGAPAPEVMNDVLQKIWDLGITPQGVTNV